MKRLLFPGLFATVFALFTTPAISQSSASSNDDIYYSPKNSTPAEDNTPPATKSYSAPQNTQGSYDNNQDRNYQDNSSGRYQNSTSSYSTDSTTGNTYVTNNYYGNQYGNPACGGFNPYMNFAYDPFYSGFGLGLGFYDQITPGFGFGLGYGFGYPYFGYDPFYSPFYNPYYGFGYYGGYYGEGFGSYGREGYYYGVRRGEGTNTRTVLSNRGTQQNTGVASRSVNPVSQSHHNYASNARVSGVPFSRPAGATATRSVQSTQLANRSTYNSGRASSSVPRSNIRANVGGRTVTQRANAGRSFFTPRGGFSSYQNSNRSISGYHSAFAGGSRSSSLFSSGSARSFSGSSSRGSSFSGGSGRSFSGGGGGGRGR